MSMALSWETAVISDLGAERMCTSVADGTLRAEILHD